MRRAPVLGLLAGLALLAGAPARAGTLTPHGPRVSVAPGQPQPGDVVLVRVTGAPPDVTGEWDGRPLRLFPVQGGLAAVVGLDLDQRPGSVGWRLRRVGPDGAPAVLARGSVTVRPKTFVTQHLALPPHQVDLDAATLARVEREQVEFRGALADSVGERLWRGAFRMPVEGGVATGGFGLRRVINGQPRSPHAGYDWAAPTGTPVAAANAGRVALVAEHFFAGRLVVLDHGLGLFTYYFHLDGTTVSTGERVAQGQPIGAVGATGRVTGPHLHLGVSIAQARVDPESLLGLRPPPETP